MTATLNGKPTRKQLGDQLDRLDGIIDVLADALPQAVADACKEGAKQAVKDALLELLGNPDVRILLAGGVAPPPPPTPTSPPVDPKPSWWGRLKEKVKALKDAVVARTRTAAIAVALTARTLTAVLPLKRIALVAGAVGLTVGIVSLVCPPLVAAAVTAVGGAVASATAQVSGLLRRHGVLAPAAE
jgi:hypothetical protein